MFLFIMCKQACPTNTFLIRLPLSLIDHCCICWFRKLMCAALSKDVGVIRKYLSRYVWPRKEDQKGGGRKVPRWWTADGTKPECCKLWRENNTSCLAHPHYLPVQWLSFYGDSLADPLNAYKSTQAAMSLSTPVERSCSQLRIKSIVVLAFACGLSDCYVVSE